MLERLVKYLMVSKITEHIFERTTTCARQKLTSSRLLHFFLLAIVRKKHVLFGRCILVETTCLCILQNEPQPHITDLLVACWVERRTFCERITISFETQTPTSKRARLRFFQVRLSLRVNTGTKNTTAFTTTINRKKLKYLTLSSAGSF